MGPFLTYVYLSVYHIFTLFFAQNFFVFVQNYSWGEKKKSTDIVPVRKRQGKRIHRESNGISPLTHSIGGIYI